MSSLGHEAEGEPEKAVVAAIIRGLTAQMARDQALAEAHAKERAEVIFIVLGAREIAVPNWAAYRIRTCIDPDVLDRWLVHAAKAQTVDDVFIEE